MNYLLVYAFVLLQSIVSIKPGFVDIADGKTNVRKYEQLNAGSTVQTGSQGHVEIGLGVDVFLRLDENSVAVLESIDSANVSVRLESGATLLEVANLDKPNSIRITTGDMRTRIDSKGVFRFSENSVSVIDGKLKIEGGSLTVQKGWKATNVGGDYRQSRLALNTPEAFRAFLKSQKAGFVNAIQGKANLHVSEVARSDRPIQTEASSYVEVLLRPGTFMRVDENSSVNFDSTGLNDIVIRVISGSMLIENIVSDPRLPVRVNVGGTKTVIAAAGLYRFTSETASVIDGVLRYGQKDETAIPGTEVRIVDQYYQTRDVTEDVLPSGLDLWSAERSHLLARPSFMSDYSDTDPSFFLFASPMPYNAAWIYSPSLNGITFVPLLTRRSYYGDSFVPLRMFLPTMPPQSRMLLPTPPVSEAPPSAKPSPTPPPTLTPAPKPAPAPVPSQK